MAQARIVRSTEGETVPGVLWLFKAVGQQTAGRFDFMVGEVEYLSGPSLHIHDDQDDTFYILDGVLTIQVEDEVFELGPGDFVTVPPGVPHTFDNLRADQPPVRAVNLMTPGGLHDFFTERAGLTGAEPETLEGLACRYGMRVVGPPLREKRGLA